LILSSRFRHPPQLLRESTQNDLSVIFVAGHGENDSGNNYYFIPHDDDADRLRRTSVK